MSSTAEISIVDYFDDRILIKRLRVLLNSVADKWQGFEGELWFRFENDWDPY